LVALCAELDALISPKRSDVITNPDLFQLTKWIKSLIETKFVKRTEVKCPGLRPRRRAEHHPGAGWGTATCLIVDRERELKSENIFSSGSPGALKNERHIETALATMERIILKRENLATRAGESEKVWGGW
jgi:hypothetical protein